MFFSLSSHTPDRSRFDDDHDRDLIALMNEARTPEAIEAASRTARARFRRRGGESAVARERTGLRRALAKPFGSGIRSAVR